jgi:hypothetical protein
MILLWRPAVAPSDNAARFAAASEAASRRTYSPKISLRPLQTEPKTKKQNKARLLIVQRYRFNDAPLVINHRLSRVQHTFLTILAFFL